MKRDIIHYYIDKEELVALMRFWTERVKDNTHAALDNLGYGIPNDVEHQIYALDRLIKIVKLVEGFDEIVEKQRPWWTPTVVCETDNTPETLARGELHADFEEVQEPNEALKKLMRSTPPWDKQEKKADWK